jgi:hypothetical protein
MSCTFISSRRLAKLSDEHADKAGDHKNHPAESCRDRAGWSVGSCQRLLGSEASRRSFILWKG